MTATLRLPPRGIRSRNPLLLRTGHLWWRGQVAAVDGYCVFDSDANGLRAGCKNLKAAQDEHGRRTVKAIISAWAPPSDGNNTADYIADVCKRIGKTPTEQLDLHHSSVLADLAVAIIWHENGQQPYSAYQIDVAVQAALKGT